jgi:crossover junction endodeoxyribonuclease RuvC
MAVLGIDPGTATTGYGLVDETADGDLTALDYGVILTPADMAMQDRLMIIYNRINEIITLHRPETMAVEKLFFQRNVTSAIAVGQARGIVLLTAALHKLPLAEYTPLEVKQAVAGYGKADKIQVQQMVKLLLKLDTIPKPDDAADALAIAITALQSWKYHQLMQQGS